MTGGKVIKGEKAGHQIFRNITELSNSCYPILHPPYMFKNINAECLFYIP